MIDKLLVLSSFTLDRFVNNKGKVLIEQDGGPAFFIKKALTKEKLKFILGSPSKFIVEILLSEKGEFGRIPAKPEVLKINYSTLKFPNLLISTVLEEIVLNNLNYYSGRVFLDIQGFVRDGEHFGSKSKWMVPKVLFDKFYCIKGTEEEINYLPKTFIKNQKQKLLLITKGSSGCEVYYQGVCYNVTPKRVIQVEDTVGAGDSFFAYFIAHFLRTEDVISSVRHAVDNTSRFLTTKSK